MIPFFLFTTGDGTIAIVPPKVVGGGFRYNPKEKRERGFSRKYALELLAAERAIERAQVKVKSAKRERKVALTQAIEAAQTTIDRASEVEAHTSELRKLTNALEAASSARKVSEAVASADLAIAAAKAFLLELKRVSDEQEEDAIMLLLLS